CHTHFTHSLIYCFLLLCCLLNITFFPYTTLFRSSSSLRLARNVQLAIKEETLVNKVVDPAGGSYFLETITKQLVEKAWDFFLEIVSQGGYQAYISSGQLEQRLKERRDFRMDKLVRNEKSLIGTNVYADPTDELDETA